MSIDSLQPHHTIPVEKELERAYLDYAMSVIVGRALPDARDGLKPVHRRVLYAMHELNNDWNKPYKKSARIVGDVIGKYHPHGDTAVYDAIVRMAQPFSMRCLLVDGQGNFGSVDGDAAAAMRYTEIRMTQLASTMLDDLDKETVDFVPNYDNTEMAPSVLPTRVPNLLVNGSSGIAVGMATNIPPHNLSEVVDACIALIDDPELDVAGMMAYIQGPDFPTAGIIHGRSGIADAYTTGRGKVYVRARTHIETDEKLGKQTIVVDELPYQVNKARLLEKMAELVKEKKVEGITALRDESDKQGMRMVIEVRRGDHAEVLLNQLFKLTSLQVVFGINMVALDKDRPSVMTLPQVLRCFIEHRREVVTRRTVFLLRKARDRAHLLEGLGLALANLDDMIELIRGSKNPQEAREKIAARSWPLGFVAELLGQQDSLCKPENLDEHYGIHAGEYHLSPVQAQAILDLKLHKLTGLEQDKIIDEFKAVIETIRELYAILSDNHRLMVLIREELEAVKAQFGTPRLTEILDANHDIDSEDLIPKEEVVVTLSQLGYAKIQTLDTYEAQRRGGKGKSATKVKDDDVVTTLFTANTHDTLLCFSDKGRVYWLKVYKIPFAGRAAKGRPIINFLPLGEDESITTIMPVKAFEEDSYLFMATRLGVVKKVSMMLFSKPRSTGVIAIALDEGDCLIGVSKTEGNSEVMLFSDAGKVIRFSEHDVRAMGRTARGVRGIRLKEGQIVVSLIVPSEDCRILTATKHGYGKQSYLSEYRQTGRGGQGVISIQVSERNGAVVGAQQVIESNEILLMSDRGTMVRTRVQEVALVGRNTQGVRLINLVKGEALVGLEVTQETMDEEGEESSLQAEGAYEND